MLVLFEYDEDEHWWLIEDDDWLSDWTIDDDDMYYMWWLKFGIIVTKLCNYS